MLIQLTQKTVRLIRPRCTFPLCAKTYNGERREEKLWRGIVDLSGTTISQVQRYTQKIKNGISRAENGETSSHQDAKQRMANPGRTISPIPRFIYITSLYRVFHVCTWNDPYFVSASAHSFIFFLYYSLEKQESGKI